MTTSPTTNPDGCDRIRCGHAEIDHFDYADRCIIDGCDCPSFMIPTEPEPDLPTVKISDTALGGRILEIDDEQGYQRLVEHLDDLDLASGFFGDS